MYAVCGTQADSAAKNKLTVMKLSEMHKTYRKADEDSDSEAEDGEDSDNEVRAMYLIWWLGLTRRLLIQYLDVNKQGADIDPLLEQRSIDHRGGVNRVRSMPQQSSIVATWADTAHVHIWDVSSLVKAIDQPTGA